MNMTETWRTPPPARPAVKPEAECVLRARRTLDLAARMDYLAAAHNWGMATAWDHLQRGELDEAEKRVVDVENYVKGRS